MVFAGGKEGHGVFIERVNEQMHRVNIFGQREVDHLRRGVDAWNMMRPHREKGSAAILQR